MGASERDSSDNMAFDNRSPTPPAKQLMAPEQGAFRTLTFVKCGQRSPSRALGPVAPHQDGPLGEQSLMVLNMILLWRIHLSLY